MCQAVTCSGTTRRCTNTGGTWQWRTSTACDDSNLCTYNDVCSGSTCAGTTITCTTDYCNGRACNGTSSCTVTPIDRCGDGICNCLETVASCPAECFPCGLDVLETFDTSALPSGWSFYDGDGYGHDWTWQNTSPPPGGSGGYWQIAAASRWFDDYLITTTYLKQDCDGINVEYDHQYDDFNSNDFAWLYISVDGGDWQQVTQYSADASGHAIHHLTPYLGSASSFKLSFRYRGLGGGYWKIDNFYLTGTYAIPPCPTVGCGPEHFCEQQICDSTTYTCTNLGGTWEWRTSTVCDDRDACTENEICAAGTCSGTEVACAAGGCCVPECDLETGCYTVPGTCGGGETCGANEIVLPSACEGCGEEGADGICGAGGTFTCDAAIHTLCQVVSCGGVTYRCTNAGGTWAWRSVAGCDDSDACTYGDVCSGGTCDGTPITCTSDECYTRTCNSTSTCTEVEKDHCGDSTCNCGETHESCPADCAGWSGNLITQTATTQGTTGANICNIYYRRRVFVATYSAAEVTAALGGLTSGTISGMRFSVTGQPANQPLPTYAIGMKNTTNSPTTNNSGSTGGTFTTVKTQASESFTTGQVKTFNFTTPFAWNGQNLAISWAWGQCPTGYSSTGENPIGAGTSYHAYVDDAGTYLVTDTAGTAASYRPVIQLYGGP
jgi:hypothetical protein